MNFILVISICSFVTGTCFVTGTSDKNYDTWNECLKDAINKSQLIMKEIPETEINKMKLATKFFCYEQEKTKV